MYHNIEKNICNNIVKQFREIFTVSDSKKPYSWRSDVIIIRWRLYHIQIIKSIIFYLKLMKWFWAIYFLRLYRRRFTAFQYFSQRCYWTCIVFMTKLYPEYHNVHCAYVYPIFKEYRLWLDGGRLFVLQCS